jgi:hypothetical protein
MPTTNLDGKGINITWKITSQRNMANATIDPNTGKITLSADDYISTDSPVALLIIEASAGSGEEKELLKYQWLLITLPHLVALLSNTLHLYSK